MFELIDQIRQKPENVKNRVAFITALTFALILLAIWFLLVLPGIKDREIDKSLAEKEKIIVSPTEGLTANVSSGWSGIKNNLSVFKENITSFISGVEYYTATPEGE